MLIVPEREVPALLTREASFDAVEKVFAAMAADKAYNFPVIREAIGHEDALYGFKGGFDKSGMALGLKAGGYWPNNLEKHGHINHQSTVFLFDPDTGMVSAMVGGNYLTALRTAAAAAVSVAHLARKDAKVLGIVGSGHQAKFQLRAVAEHRNFERVVAWNRSPEKLDSLRAVAAEIGLPFESASLANLGAQSDVIVTITSSFDAILLNEHVKPGTHIACMGTDTKGKQEVAADLVARANLFTDEVAQSISIGEAQHAIANGSITETEVQELGAVINGAIAGRTTDDEVTLFDGTGVGLQDLAVASSVVELAVAQGKATEIAF